MQHALLKRGALVASGLAIAVALAACGSSGSPEGPPSGSDRVIQISAVQPVSGAFAVFGADIVNGIKLAEKVVNDEDLLAGTKIRIDIKDENSTPATAASLTAEIANSDAVAVIGPPGSANALAAAPIAQRSGLPYVAILSFVDGVVETGDHIFRISTPLNALSGLTMDEIAARGAERVAYIYNLENPTLVELAEDYLSNGLEERGIEVVASIGTPPATSYSQLVAQLLQAQPDMVGILHTGPANPEILSDLREQGYSGEVFTHGAAAGLYDAMPQHTEGMFYSTDFTLNMPYETTAAFTEAYQSEYGHPASTYAAAGYDAVMFLVQSIVGVSDDGTVDRADVLRGMQALAESGEFVGNVGPISFIGEGNRSALAGGVLVELVAGEEKVIKTG